MSFQRLLNLFLLEATVVAASPPFLVGPELGPFHFSLFQEQWSFKPPTLRSDAPRLERWPHHGLLADLEQAG